MSGRMNINRRKKVIPGLITYLLIIALSVGGTLLFTGSKDKENNISDFLPAEQHDSGQKSDNSNNIASKEFTFVDNWYMNTRARFTLGGIWHRMGDLNEILGTVKNIRHTSELSWFREWNKTAEKVRAAGDISLDKGHDISAGEAYLRATSYYLAAEVFLHTNPDDPRIVETYKKGQEYFLKGLKLLSVPVEEVRIPYENTTLKGYYFKTDVTDKAPVLLVHQGFDAPIESTKYIAEEAIRRGYNCLLFEGPGQGLTIREQNLPFRPDWENVVTPAVDYLIKRPDIDRENIILMGISMGGGFAARAAAFETRIKLTIVNPGYVNIYGIMEDWLTPELINLYNEDPVEFDNKFKEMAEYDVGIRWGVYHGMWVFGADTPSEFLDRLKEFDNTDITGSIKGKMLVMDGADEQWGKGQAKKLYDALTGEKYYMQFTEEDFAAGHCQTGAAAISTQRMFDWLDENL